MTATLEAMLATALPPDTLVEHLAPWSDRELAFSPADAVLVVGPQNRTPLRTQIHLISAAEPTTQQDIPPPDV